MTSPERTNLTSPKARDIHAAAQQADPDHDLGGCWCCCLDCNFDTKAVCANDASAGIETVV